MKAATLWDGEEEEAAAGAAEKSENASNFYSSRIDQMKLKAQHIRNDDYVIGVINLTKR